MVIPLNIDSNTYDLLREQAQENDEALLDYMARKLGEVALAADAKIAYTQSSPERATFRIRNLWLRK